MLLCRNKIELRDFLTRKLDSKAKRQIKTNNRVGPSEAKQLALNRSKTHRGATVAFIVVIKSF